MIEALDKQLATVAPYAAALFELAREQDQVREIDAELAELIKLEQIEPSFRAFMESSALDDDHRAAGLERMLRGKLSDVLLNTLLVMNRNGRHGMLAALKRQYDLIAESYYGMVEARALSAVELSDSHKQAVEQVAAGLSGKKPIMTFDVSADILGGLILEIGDMRFDYSVRTQLQTAKRRLASRGEVGLTLTNR
ncbi:ATP synthase subunit delta [Phycisphaerae bacterium RAS1]|nr:ATP synthase subunit delta [Phycisphaerae bacterium RAS1]